MSKRNSYSTTDTHEHGHRHGRRGQRGDKKRQQAGGLYWLYGMHAVSAALANPERRVMRIVCLREMAGMLPLSDEHPRPEIVEQKDMVLRLGTEAVHQGVAIEVAPLDAPYLEDVLRADSAQPLVVLDQVTDPHNIGAILRSAAAFGAAAVVVPKDHAPSETAVMAKAASGAMDIVPYISVTNLAQAITSIKEAGYWVMGLDGEAKEALTPGALSGKTCLVFGAEGRGMRRLTAESCDRMLRLEMDARMESLNVSNAAAIALYCLYQPRG